jgi:hypothetical protein
MAKQPVRRAGMRTGLNGKCPSPFDGLNDPQNTARGQYSERGLDYKGTNEEVPPGIGKGNPGTPAAEAANRRSNRNRGR